MTNKKCRKTCFLIVFVILTAFICSSCSCYKTDKADFKVVNLEKDYGNCDSNDSPCVQINIQYPEIKDAPADSVKNKINNVIRNYSLQTISEGKKVETFDSLADDLITSFKEQRQKFPESPARWYFDRETSVVFNNKFVFSIEAAESSFLGGAHPNTFKVYYNFNLKTGAQFKLTDLFLSDSLKKLTKIAESVFRKDRKMNNGETYKEAGYWFKDDQFSLNDNFAVTEDGILFYYNDYEIAPYVYGPTKLLIPYNRIKEMIKTDGPLDGILQK